MRVEQSTAASLATFEIPRLADLYETCGTDFELSVDAKSHAVARPLIEVARAAGAAERLWLCTPNLALLRSLREEGAPCRLVHSRRRAGSPRRSNATPRTSRRRASTR